MAFRFSAFAILLALVLGCKTSKLSSSKLSDNRESKDKSLLISVPRFAVDSILKDYKKIKWLESNIVIAEGSRERADIKLLVTDARGVRLSQLEKNTVDAALFLDPKAQSELKSKSHNRQVIFKELENHMVYRSYNPNVDFKGAYNGTHKTWATRTVITPIGSPFLKAVAIKSDHKVKVIEFETYKIDIEKGRYDAAVQIAPITSFSEREKRLLSDPKYFRTVAKRDGINGLISSGYKVKPYFAVVAGRAKTINKIKFHIKF